MTWQEQQLEKAATYLSVWQKAERKAKRSTSARCLEAVRAALNSVGLHLPLSNIDYPSMLAIDNFYALSANPGKWRWQPVHHNPDGSWPVRYCLVYFKKCGWLDNKKLYAGHIAILDVAQNKIWANNTYTLTPRWAGLLVGGFQPK